MPKGNGPRGFRRFYVLNQATTARSELCTHEELLEEGQIVLLLGSGRKKRNIAESVQIAIVTTDNTLPEQDDDKSVILYRIAPQTIDNQEKDTSGEINAQYMINPHLTSPSTELVVHVHGVRSLRSLPIQPRSYLKLGPRILRVPFETLTPATAVQQNSEIRSDLYLTQRSSDMVDKGLRSFFGTPLPLSYWPQYTDEATRTIGLSTAVRESTEEKTAVEEAAVEKTGGGSIQSQSDVYTPNFVCLKTALQKSREAAERQATSTRGQPSKRSLSSRSTSKQHKNVKATKKGATKKAELRRTLAAREAEATSLGEPDNVLPAQQVEGGDIQRSEPRKCKPKQPRIIAKFYTLTSGIEDLEAGQLVFTLSKVSSKAEGRTVEVAIVTLDEDVKKKHAADRFTLYPLAPTRTPLSPVASGNHRPLYVQDHDAVRSHLPKRWCLKVEPFPLRIPWDLLAPKLAKRDQVVDEYDDGRSEEVFEAKGQHLSMGWPSLKKIWNEMEKLINPESKAGEWGEAWQKEIGESSDDDGIDWE
ncbi:hypothetical protein FKW77_003358 [Venturia effusa]|uniref:Uncharacterized protein n=1 Tax=Venturia effusa TaxID=50376 RepID=A0A517L8Y0_9PEZI|nr:hypothetical protein FKW77_003358 [Venturia effusa]